MLNRRAGASRLIDWTGERAVPWTPDPNVAYEHFHRYLWAQTLVARRRVLDVGSGEGYGSSLLTASAASVVGIDIDTQAVEHSRLNYAATNLTFEVASATDLRRFPDGAFDAVVAFEVFEHVDDQKAMLAEIHRLLADDGFVVLSTPDRRAYTEATGTTNPYHVHELTEEELRDALGEYFEHVCLFGQRPATGSRIESLDQVDPAPSPSFTLVRHGGDWMPAGAMSPLYLIAVASASALPALAPDSTLSDYELGLLRAAEQALETALGDVAQLKDQLAAVTDAQSRLQDQLAATTEENSRLQAEHTTTSAAATEAKSRLRDQLAAVTDAQSRLQDQLAAVTDAQSRLHYQLAATTEENSRLQVEQTTTSADAAALKSELAAARRELAAACADESARNRLEAEVADLTALVSASVAAAGQPDDERPLDEVIGALRAEAESFRFIRASRSYGMLARSLRVLGRLAPPGTRRRAVGRLIVHGRV